MTPNKARFESVARELIIKLCYCNEETWDHSKFKAEYEWKRDIVTQALEQTWNEAIEQSADRAIETWKHASNEPPTWRQNALAAGCNEAAKQIRALKIKEGVSEKV